MKRRTFLQLLGASALAPRPLWAAVKDTEQYFVFIHASGGPQRARERRGAQQLEKRPALHQ